MKTTPTPAAISALFINDNPAQVWSKAVEIIRRLSPEFDLSLVQSIFDDVIRLFRGEYPGYCEIRMLYHDLQHTLDAFLCAVRLMYGLHTSGTRLTDDELTIIMMAALMHDIGYAQLKGEESGTGAQYTLTHVKRGIEFMQQYIIEKHLPASYAIPLKYIILCTNPAINITEIQFPDERTRLLGQIIGTADLVGQMADRNYPEKLLFLYLEFEEGHVGNYQNVHVLLRNTQAFYKVNQLRLDEQFDNINRKLSFYFRDWYGTENNYYQESIEKNIAYLAKVTAFDDTAHFSMLKRAGIVKRLPG
ncbi:MAG: HD domain-containing protein [Proteobacteria bacterium]|nr:HD domain-containing protein [Pseudomonadota bacterium]